MSDRTDLLEDIGIALGHTIFNHALDFLITGLIMKPLSKTIAYRNTPASFTGARRLFTARTLTKISPDGGFLDGPAKTGWAKFAIRKGLPIEENSKVMAVENPPHEIDDFSGEIKEGYGKGTKKLLYTGNAVIKIGDKRHIGKINIHQHDAERAGKHFDFVAEGVPSGAEQFEVSIGAGPFKGRYAFIRLKGQVLITRMKDRSVLLAKPNFVSKNIDFLKEIEKNPQDWIVEHKLDGSLGNCLIRDNRAIFRSHREGGDVYYDKLPGLEDLANRSNLFTSRLLFPDPDLDGTIIQGELFHKKGAAYVGGVLNSGADKAIVSQERNGPVSFHSWDIKSYKGKDISSLPYEQRRLLLESTIRDIQRFNNNWYVVPRSDAQFVRFYERITANKSIPALAEGVVIKRRGEQPANPWYKIKDRDSVDLRVVSIQEGTGKREGRVGRMVVETPEGTRGEVGSFMATDEQLEWMFRNKDVLEGQVAEFYVQEMTERGAPRAGVFYRWHTSKSEHALLMYAEGLEPDNPKEMLYKLKSSVGWRKK